LSGLEERRKVQKDVKYLRLGKRYRISITLTEELIAKLDEESGKYGLSRSAFIEWRLRENLGMVGKHF